MGKKRQDHDDEVAKLRREVEDLRLQLEEAKETLRAIQSGEVDGLVISTPEGERVFMNEEALRESEVRLRLLGDNLPDSAVYQYTYDTDGRPQFLYFSAGIEHLNGVRLADVLRDAGTLHRQILPEDFERLVEAEARGRRDLTDFHMDIPMRRPDGEVRWMQVHSRPRRLPSGQVVWDGVQTDITDRKRAEEALRASEEQFRAYFDNAAVGTTLIGLDARFLQVNDRFCQITGYSREELLTMPSSALWPPEERESGDRTLLAFLRGEGGDFEIQKRYVRKDGQVIWVQINEALIRDAAGRSVRAAGVVQDITQRKRAEESLLERERFIESVTTTSLNWFYVFDLDRMGLSYTNRSILGDLGFPPEVQAAVTGLQAFQSFMPPEELPHLSRVIEDWRTLADGCIRDDEYRLQHADGTLRYFAGREIVFARRPDGTVRHILGSLVDVTARKQAEQTLRESEQRLALALESGEMGLWEWDVRTDHFVWNVKEYELLGLPPGPGREPTKAFWDRVHPADLPEFERVCAAILDHGGELNHEVRIIRPDGQVRWLAAVGRLFRDAHGKPLRMLGVNFDITHRKRTEQDRQQLLEAERAARGEIERVNRMKDEFLSTISHEPSPLSAVLGWTRLLRRGKADDKDRALGVIESNAQSLGQMIDDMLDIGRIMSGKVRLSMEDSEPRSLVADAVEGFRPAMQAKGVALHEQYEEGLGVLSCDPGRIRQVLSNLLGNALKFTPSGGRIRVRLRRRGSRLQLIVRDSGQGIAREFLPHLFGKFLQADASTTRKHGGLGLGLAIVKQIVDLHGGTIRASSAGTHRGAVFVVSLPCTDSAVVVRPSETTTLKVDDGLELPTGMNILLVDDDPEFLAILSRVLAESGASVRQASSAAEALHLFHEHHPALVVSDISMPVDDGYSLVRRIRAMDGPAARTICVAVTALARPEDRERALAMGFAEHLSKLTDPTTIVRIVRGLVVKSMLDKFTHEVVSGSRAAPQPQPGSAAPS